MSETATPAPTDPREKFLRFVRAGGDLASVPDEVWSSVGPSEFREKLTRFAAAGGDRATVRLPETAVAEAPPAPTNPTEQAQRQTLAEMTMDPATYAGLRPPARDPGPIMDRFRSPTQRWHDAMVRPIVDPLMEYQREAQRHAADSAVYEASKAETAKAQAEGRPVMAPAAAAGGDLQILGKAGWAGARSLFSGLTSAGSLGAFPAFSAAQEYAQEQPSDIGDRPGASFQERQLRNVPLGVDILRAPAVGMEAFSEMTGKGIDLLGADRLPPSVRDPLHMAADIAVTGGAIKGLGGLRGPPPRVPYGTRSTGAPLRPPEPPLTPIGRRLPPPEPPLTPIGRRLPPPTTVTPPAPGALSRAPIFEAALPEPVIEPPSPSRSLGVTDPVRIEAIREGWSQRGLPEFAGRNPSEWVTPGETIAEALRRAELERMTEPMRSPTARIGQGPSPEAIRPRPVSRLKGQEPAPPIGPVPTPEATAPAPATPPTPVRVRGMRRGRGQRGEAYIPGPTPEQLAEAARILGRALDDPKVAALAAALAEKGKFAAAAGVVAPQAPLKGPTIQPTPRGLAGVPGAPRPSRVPTMAAVENAVEPVRVAYERVASVPGKAFETLVRRIPGGARVLDKLVTPQDLVDPKGDLFRFVSERRGTIQYEEGQAGRVIRKAEKAGRKLSEQDWDQTYRYMGGEDPALPAGVPPKFKDAVHDLVLRIQKLRDAQLQRGMMSPETHAEYPRFLVRHMRLVDLAAREKRGVGVKAGGSYKVDPTQYRQDAYGAIVRLTRAEVDPIAAKHGGTVHGGHATQTPLVKFTDAAGRDAFLADVKGRFAQARSRLQGQATGEIKAGDVGQAKMLHKGALDVPKAGDVIVDTFDPLDLAERAAYGEVRNPLEAAALTIRRASQRVATWDLLKKIETEGKANPTGPLGVMDPVNGQKPPAGMVVFEETGGRPNPLNGKWVNERLAEHLTTAEQTWTTGSEFLDNIMPGWKEAHFVQNPGTQGRNIIALPAMSIMSGVNMLNPLNWPLYARTFKAIGSGLRGGNDPLYRMAIERGWIKQDFASAELADAASRAAGRGESVSAILGRVFGGDITKPLEFLPGRAGKTAKRVRQTARDIYGILDDVIRLTVAQKLLARLMEPTAILNELDATTANYARQGPAVRAVSNIPLAGPAVRFSTEMLRIAKNNAKAHPVRLAELLAIVPILKALFAERVTPEEHEALEQEFGWQMIPTGRDEQGRPRGYDPRWVHPLGNVMGGPEEGTPGSIIRWLAQATVGESPLVNAISEAQTGKDRWGRDVTSPENEGSAIGLAKETGDWWRRHMGPPLAGRGYDRLAAAAGDRPLSSGRPVQTMEDAIISQLLGFTIGSLDYPTARVRAVRKAEGAEAEWGSHVGKARTLKLGDEEGRRRMDEAREGIRGAQDEAARRLSVLDAAERAWKKAPK